MFPFVVQGETRIPPEVRHGLDLADAVKAVAAFLRAQGAKDLRVNGDAIAYTYPWGLRFLGAMDPSDGGAVQLRDEGGTLVVSFRVLMRGAVTRAALWLAVPVTFGLDTLAPLGLLAGSIGVLGLVGVVLTRRWLARGIRKHVAQAADRLATGGTPIALPRAVD